MELKTYALKVEAPLTEDERARFEKHVRALGIKKGAFVRFAILAKMDADERFSKLREAGRKLDRLAARKGEAK